MSVPRPLITFESENVSCRFDRINRATREFRSHQVVQNLSKFGYYIDVSLLCA